MALTDDGGSNMVLPVTPMGNNGGFGGDWGSWLIVLLVFGMMFGGGFGGFGGYGGGMMNFDFPWLLNGQNGVNANVNAGFQNAALQSAIGDLNTAVTSGFGDVQLGIAGVNQAICQTGNGITAAVTGAQNALAQQLYSNEIANLNRSFAEQTANVQGFNGLQSQLAQCCCDNRLATVQTQNVIQSEAATTRAANSTNTQAILDKLCQLELDGVKAQVEAKNDRIAELTAQLNFANLAASQNAQTAQIRDGQTAAVTSLVNELRSCPIPSQPVYGSQPIFTCPNNNSGCGCNNNGFAFA